jgi:tetratricopeptide (TPR) repeat protein
MHADVGQVESAEHHLQKALGYARELSDAALCAGALWALVNVRYRQGRLEEAMRLSEEGLIHARRTGHQHLIGGLLIRRGMASHAVDPDRTRADYLEAIGRLTTIGDRYQTGIARNNLADHELQHGNLDVARDHLEAGLRDAREIGSNSITTVLSLNLGMTAILQGDPLAAERAFTEALNLARQMDHWHWMAGAVRGRAFVATRWGDPRRAAILHGAARQILDNLGEAVETLEARLCEIDYRQLRESLGEGEFDMAFAHGRDMSPQEIFDCATASTKPIGSAAASRHRDLGPKLGCSQRAIATRDPLTPRT